MLQCMLSVSLSLSLSSLCHWLLFLLTLVLERFILLLFAYVCLTHQHKHNALCGAARERCTVPIYLPTCVLPVPTTPTDGRSTHTHQHRRTRGNRHLCFPPSIHTYVFSLERSQLSLSLSLSFALPDHRSAAFSYSTHRAHTRNEYTLF